MEHTEHYRGFSICVFEREPKRWRAKISKVNDTDVMTEVPRARYRSITTSSDSYTAEDAIKLAKRVIDAGGVK